MPFCQLKAVTSAERHSAECHSAERHSAECHSAERHSAEYHSVVCHSGPNVIKLFTAVIYECS